MNVRNFKHMFFGVPGKTDFQCDPTSTWGFAKDFYITSLPNYIYVE